MENYLQQNNLANGQVLQTSDSTFPLLNQQIFNIIKDINMIIQFTYTDNEIMEWSLAITRIKPKTTVDVMRSITDKFLSGEIKFDRSKGILNYTEKVYEHLGIFE